MTDDTTCRLDACGSSFREMPRYGAWEYEVAAQCFEEVDYISLHQSFRNDDNDIAKSLTCIDDLERLIKDVTAIVDAVAATPSLQR